MFIFLSAFERCESLFLHQFTIIFFTHVYVNKQVMQWRQRRQSKSFFENKKKKIRNQHQKGERKTWLPKLHAANLMLRKALRTIQTSKQASSTPDFELGPPAPGLSPSSCTKAVSSPIQKKQPDLEISLSGFSTDDSTQSETILSHKTPEKVSYLLCTVCILLRYEDTCSL